MNVWESLSIPLEVQTFALQSHRGMFVCAIVLAVAALMRAARRTAALRNLCWPRARTLAVPRVGVGRIANQRSPGLPSNRDEVVKVPAEMLPELLDRAGADQANAPAESPAFSARPGQRVVALWRSRGPRHGRLLYACEAKPSAGRPALRADF